MIGALLNGSKLGTCLIFGNSHVPDSWPLGPAQLLRARVIKRLSVEGLIQASQGGRELYSTISA